ncbi:MAG: hypothetical protein ABI628_11660 [Chloroflexota bacterium]
MSTDEIDAHRERRRTALDGPAVVAYTTEDDLHPEIRRAAEAHARKPDLVLILYAADVASWLSEPMPNQWGSEGEGERFGDRLSATDLDALGRAAIADQVRDAQRDGVRAAAWLPKDKGGAAMAEYAVAEAAQILFVPASLDSIEEVRSTLAASGNAVELRVVEASDSAEAQ